MLFPFEDLHEVVVEHEWTDEDAEKVEHVRKVLDESGAVPVWFNIAVHGGVNTWATTFTGWLHTVTKVTFQVFSDVCVTVGFWGFSLEIKV